MKLQRPPPSGRHGQWSQACEEVRVGLSKEYPSRLKAIITTHLKMVLESALKKLAMISNKDYCL